MPRKEAQFMRSLVYALAAPEFQHTSKASPNTSTLSSAVPRSRSLQQPIGTHAALPVSTVAHNGFLLPPSQSLQHEHVQHHVIGTGATTTTASSSGSGASSTSNSFLKLPASHSLNHADLRRSVELELPLGELFSRNSALNARVEEVEETIESMTPTLLSSVLLFHGSRHSSGGGANRVRDAHRRDTAAADFVINTLDMVSEVAAQVQLTDTTTRTAPHDQDQPTDTHNTLPLQRQRSFLSRRRGSGTHTHTAAAMSMSKEMEDISHPPDLPPVCHDHEDMSHHLNVLPAACKEDIANNFNVPVCNTIALMHMGKQGDGATDSAYACAEVRVEQA